MGFTRALLSAAAIWLGALGVACLFAPDHVLVWLGSDIASGSTLLVQVLGTLALGLAAIDWMWKGNRVGGIYGRPVTLANLLHFTSTALVIVTGTSREPDLAHLWPLAVLQAMFAAAFFRIMFTDPQAPRA